MKPRKNRKRETGGAGVTLLLGMDLRRVNGATVHSLNLVKALKSAGVNTQVISLDSLRAPQALWLFNAPFKARNEIVFLRSGFPLIPVILLRLLGKKVVLNVAALKHLECNALARPFLKLCEDLAIRFAWGVATISPHLAGYARKHGAKRVFVYPLCVDTQKFGGAKAKARALKHRGKNKKLVLGYVGSGDEWQGLPLLAQALKAGGKELDELGGVELRVYGRIQGRQKKLLEEDARVKINEPVKNELMPSVMKSFDLMVLPRPHHPSAEYATPIKLVEAMACGVPCLVTDVAGMTWLLKDKRNAIVCEASPEGVLAGLRWARAHEKKLRAIGVRGQARAREADYARVGKRFKAFLRL